MPKQSSIEAVISELEARKKQVVAEIDEAIDDLRKVQKSGVFAGAVTGRGTVLRVKGQSAYKLAVKALEGLKKPVAMPELASLILEAGYTSKSDKPNLIVSTSLYKAIADGKRCVLVKHKDGKIGLKGWK